MQTLRTSSQYKKKTKQFVDQNPVEAFRDLGRGVAGSVKNDLLAGSASDLWEQFLGAEKQADQLLSGDIAPGTELDLNQINKWPMHEPEAPEIDRRLPAIDYHREVRTAEIKVVQENQAELAQKIAQILVELKKLVKASKEVENEFKQISVETVPAKAGQYHLNFFEWFLGIIRNANLRASEAKSWLSVLYQKRTKRGYWNMFKKHGTTFGLSHERVVATQTG